MTDPSVCRICHRQPNTFNNVLWQCSHADCPHRRKAWSERPNFDNRDEWGVHTPTPSAHPLDDLFDAPGKE